MLASDFIFYALSLLALAGGVGVLMFASPIYSALSLAASMIALAGLFANLGAWFVAGVQLIVYAGAVLVLFVMVVMLFNLKTETKPFSRGFVSGGLKIFFTAVVLGLILGSVYLAPEGLFPLKMGEPVSAQASMQSLSQLLFWKYVFSFELMGVLLLVIAIGAVALSRIEGGTHADE